MSTEVQHKERAHALLSASGAYRWMVCTPSAILETRYANESSSFAEEGTLAHELSELKIRSALNLLLGIKETKEETKLRREKTAGIKINKYYSPEMEELTTEYCTYVMNEFNEARRIDAGAIMLIEQKLDFSEYVPDGFGTGDVLIVFGNTIIVIDLKYGAGKKVSAHQNPQMKFYGLGAINALGDMYDLKDARLTIYQPRMDNISTFETPVSALIDFALNEVSPKAAMAFEGKGELVTGDHCGFCLHKAKCAAMFKETQALFDEVKEDIFTTSDADLLQVFEKSSRVSSYLDAVAAHIKQTALEGKAWEGYKIVEGRANRVITDTEKADSLLKAEGFTDEDIYNMKLKGLGDLEKLVGKKNFETILGSVVHKPAGAPTIAPESDKRPALNLVDSAKKLFEDLDN